METTTMTDAMANTDMRGSSVRPWRGADRAHTGVLAGFQGTSVSVADRAACVVTGLIDDTTAPTTGDVYPHLEVPPV